MGSKCPCGVSSDIDHYCEGRSGRSLDGTRVVYVSGGDPDHNHKWKQRRNDDGSWSDDHICKCGAIWPTIR